MRIPHRLTRIRRVLRKMSRLGPTGFNLASFVYWHGLRKYQEYVYSASATEPFMAVTTCIGCKNRCKFCPQDTFVHAYTKRAVRLSSIEHVEGSATVLSLDAFKGFLERVPKHFVINFAGFSEPWQAPDCTDMVLAAHARGHKIRVFTTLVGMEPNDVYGLTKIPFDLFSVHVPDEGPSTRISVDQQMLNTLRAVEKYGFSQLEFHNHIGRPHPEFLRVFGAFEIHGAGVVDRAGNLSEEGKLPKPKRINGRIRCGFNPHSNELNHNVLLPNGDVVLCCEDYGLKHTLGNLHNSDLLSIYDSEPYRTIKRGLDDDSIDLLCRYCHRAIQVDG